MIVVVGIIVSIVGIVDKSQQVNSLPGYPGTKNLCQVHQSNDLMSMLFYNLPNIFLPKWSKLIQNGQFWPFCNFSNIFLLKCSEFIRNGQFWLFCNFSSIFLPKWSKLIQNGQFGLFCNFSSIFLPKWSRLIQKS